MAFHDDLPKEKKIKHFIDMSPKWAGMALRQYSMVPEKPKSSLGIPKALTFSVWNAGGKYKNLSEAII